MRLRIRQAIVATALLLLVNMPLGAVTVTRLSSKGNVVDYNFFFNDGQCHSGEAFVSAAESMSHLPGDVLKESRIAVFLTRRNDCTGDTEVQAFGVGDAATLVFDTRTNTAHVEGVVSVLDDVSGASFEVTLSLSAGGLGSVSTSTCANRTVDLTGGRQMSNYNISSQPASVLPGGYIRDEFGRAYESDNSNANFLYSKHLSSVTITH